MKIKKCYLYLQNDAIKHATEQEVRTLGEKKYFGQKGIENYVLVQQTKKDIEEATSLLTGGNKKKRKRKKGTVDSFDINDRVKDSIEESVKDNEEK